MSDEAIANFVAAAARPRFDKGPAGGTTHVPDVYDDLVATVGTYDLPALNGQHRKVNDGAGEKDNPVVASYKRKAQAAAKRVRKAHADDPAKLEDGTPNPSGVVRAVEVYRVSETEWQALVSDMFTTHNRAT